MRLKDRVAVVTGAAQGLGKVFALGFAGEGARIVVSDIQDGTETVREIQDLGGEAIFCKTDVSREEDTQAMAKAAHKAFGRIDILVNNAAVYAGIKRKPFHEIDMKEWDLVFAVNVRGAFLAVKAVYPYMKEQQYGKIVNLASEVFFTGSNGFVHYVASKGGIVGLTRALAIELGPENICINAVAPGFTDTEASRTIADVGKYDTTKTPLQRLERPEDLLGAVLFLASGDSDFITGQTLLVDGGRAMH
ncbi:MAG: SDR family NAD(P)-dependent oxidoreductase [Desulfatiglandales bacterium]